MRTLLCLAAGALAALGAACGDAVPDPCTGPNGPCRELSPGDNIQVEFQTALIDAQPGDVIYLHRGTYQLELGLSLLVDHVTLRGDGPDETILSFKRQLDGAQGLLVTANDFTIEDLAVEDTVGDAIKVEGGQNVTFRRVRAEWTRGPDAINGSYGLYPVQCENVLIEDSVVRGASDAGIYVGQSHNIIVRRSTAEYNVAGIEIENSTDADVYQNLATNNAGGILVFNLPGLQVKNGARTRVFDNDITENNWPNFAPAGNIVGHVPQGTGFASIAAHDVEIFGNRIGPQQTANSAVVSFLITMLAYDDPEYNPYSDTIYFHDNTYTGTADHPSGDLGLLLAGALGTVKPSPVVVPDIVFDGYRDPTKMDGAQLAAKYNLCVQHNGDADFADLDAAHNFAKVSLDPAPFDCSHPHLAAIAIPGVK